MAEQAGGGAGSGTYLSEYQTQLLAFMLAISGIESGGANDPLTVQSHVGAKGIFQFMDSTWRSIAPALGVRASTAAQVSAEDQWRVAAALMTQYYNQFKSWDMVAVSWFAGPGAAQDIRNGESEPWTRSDGNATVREYVDLMSARLNDNLRAGVSSDSSVAQAAMAGSNQYNAPTAGQQNIQTVPFDVRTDGSGHPGDSDRFSRSSDPGGPLPAFGAMAPGAANPYDQGGATAGYGSQTAAGQGGGSAADTDASGTVDEDELAAHIQRTYPQMLWALDHPELGPILRESAENSWDNARLYGALIQTGWWKSHPDRDRVLINMRANDPATYQRMLDQQIATIRETGEQLGWGTLPPERLRALSVEAMHNAWSAQQIQDALVEAMPVNIDAINDGTVGGRVAEIARIVDQTTNEYMIKVSDVEKKQWIQRILRGEVDEEAFRNHAKTVALGQYAWMADAMERGLTPKQFTDPYRNWIAQTMETSPETINMMDARNQDVLYDRAEGRIRTLPEVEEYVKRNFEGWTRTRQANEQYATVNETLLQTFGKVA